MTRLVFAAAVTFVALGFVAVCGHAQAPALPAGGTSAQEQSTAVKVFALQHANAEEMQRIISDLFGPSRSQPAAFGRGGIPRQGLRTSADPRTNSLIIMGPESELEVIEALVSRLDTQSEQSGAEGSASQPRNSADRPGRSDASRFLRPSRSRTDTDSPPSLAKKSIAGIASTRIQAPDWPLKEASLDVFSVAPVGKKVKKGDVLVTVDSTPLEDAIAAAEVDVRRHRTALQQSEAALTIATLQRETDVADANLQIELAKLEKNEFQEGTRPLELEARRQEIMRAERELEQWKGHVESGSVESESVDALEVSLKLAKLRLDVFEKFSVAKRLRELEGAVTSAERHLMRVRLQTEAGILAAKAEAASRSAQAALTSSRLNRLQDQLALRKIVAPHDGIIAAGPTPVSSGSKVRPRQVLLYLVPNRIKSEE